MEKKPLSLNSSMAVLVIAIIFDGPNFIKYPLLIATVVLLVMGVKAQQQQEKKAMHPSDNTINQ